MKKDDLKQCLDTLSSIKARKYGSLDAGVIAELDSVIAQLQKYSLMDGDSVPMDERLEVQALSTIGKIAEATTNLLELAKQFFDGQ